jgi:hypothetical protein
MAAEGGMGERGLRRAEGGTGSGESVGVSEYGSMGVWEWEIGSEQRKRGGAGAACAYADAVTEGGG